MKVYWNRVDDWDGENGLLDATFYYGELSDTVQLSDNIGETGDEIFVTAKDDNACMPGSNSLTQIISPI